MQWILLKGQFTNDDKSIPSMPKGYLTTESFHPYLWIAPLEGTIALQEVQQQQDPSRSEKMTKIPIFPIIFGNTAITFYMQLFGLDHFTHGLTNNLMVAFFKRGETNKLWCCWQQLHRHTHKLSTSAPARSSSWSSYSASLAYQH